MKELDIREVANLTGVTPSALRYYEKKGLIKPIGRNGLRRQYNEIVVNKLQLIALGQAAGFCLDEIADMFSEDNNSYSTMFCFFNEQRRSTVPSAGSSC